MSGGRYWANPAQPTLPLPRPDTRPRATCPHCGQDQPVFLFDPKAPAPWWYLIAHCPVAGPCSLGDCPHEVQFLGACLGSGYPAVEQSKPDVNEAVEEAS